MIICNQVEEEDNPNSIILKRVKLTLPKFYAGEDSIMIFHTYLLDLCYYFFIGCVVGPECN